MDDVRREGRQRRKKLGSQDEESGESIIKPLTMVHMQGPFLLYIVCVIICFIALLCEIFSVTCFK